MQTKKYSLYEQVVNIAVGFGLALITASFVFPLFGVESNFSQNFGITCCYALVSFIRGYVIRRWFARKTEG